MMGRGDETDTSASNQMDNDNLPSDPTCSSDGWHARSWSGALGMLVLVPETAVGVSGEHHNGQEMAYISWWQKLIAVWSADIHYYPNGPGGAR